VPELAAPRNLAGEDTPPAAVFTRVSAGTAHRCGIEIDGTIVCWGDNSSGQSTPPAGTFMQISAGGDQTCGLKIDGTIVCWGDNSSGQSTPPATASVH
jgi:alpha-tubulin suppressor-like RCC1 family protein